MDDVLLRDAEDGDLEAFFAHEADPDAAAMAAFPTRDREQFAAHWARIRADRTVVLRTIVAGGAVAGNIVSWPQDGERLVGYWVGRAYWGRGIASRALARFTGVVPERPLVAHVAVHNAGSVRVLQKCGFQRDPVREAQQPAPADGVEEHVYVLTRPPVSTVDPGR